MKRRPIEPDSKFKPCSMCGRPILVRGNREYCSICEDNALFKEVREYIRSHDVNEYELAEIFHIPQSKVHNWIKEGRIEYASGENKMVSTRCQRCGAPVSFGTLCSGCMRVMNGNKEISYISSGQSHDRNRMRFLLDEDK